MKNPTPEQIHSRRWATLGVLCLSLLVVVVDGSIVNVALPTLVRHLHASTSALQWVVDAYTLAVAGLLLTLGSLGDRIGRHRTLAGGLIVFGLGSALAAMSTSAGELIACRVVMGIGAAAVMPATLSILTNVFTVPAERAKAIAMWSAVAGLGVVIGPTLGGWLLEHFAWGSIFMVNLPIVGVALVAGRLVVPPSANPHPRALDPIGALLSMAGILAVVYAIIEAPSHGWVSPMTLGTRRRGPGIARELWLLRAAQHASDGGPAHLRQRPVQRGQLRGDHDLPGPLRLAVPLHPAAPVRPRLLRPGGRRALPSLRAHHGRGLCRSSAKVAARVGTKVVVTARSGARWRSASALLSTASVHTGYPLLMVASMLVAAGMGLAMAPATESIMGSLPRPRPEWARPSTTPPGSSAAPSAWRSPARSPPRSSPATSAPCSPTCRLVTSPRRRARSVVPSPSAGTLRGPSGSPSSTLPARRSWPDRTGRCSSPSWPPPSDQLVAARFLPARATEPAPSQPSKSSPSV